MVKLSWYESPSGRTEARDKYTTGSDDLKANFDIAVLYLISLPRSDWIRPEFAKLDRCKKIFNEYYEIRLKADNVQQRPIGYWINDDEFVILLWAKEKGKKIIPKNWCIKAEDRRGKLENGEAGKKPVLDDIKKQ
jgi:hypothetical protein